MMLNSPVVSDPASYGSKSQSWHPDFVAYMVDIYNDPAFEGMPDALKSDGKIQWEAPSNRSGGQYQYTHQKRATWWRKKAEEIGIDPNSSTWISDTAKKIHPFGEKPCKRCGRAMRIAYSYPNAHIKRRLANLYEDKVEYDPLEPIDELLARIVNILGDGAYPTFGELLASKSFKIPDLGSDLNKWLDWLLKEYIPSEPTTLSPGAMSNAPDRFDGFHSFNLCCRKLADTGRSDANLRSYTTDRRVFEYWSEGNWIAADKLMGIINSEYRDEPTADGGHPPATADHIGPLSLGFLHRPEFRLLSKTANSAKNNRMTLWDVQYLIATEERNEQVVSWHAKKLWDLRKRDVKDEENALRLSKLMRDNQRNFVHLLYEVYKSNHLIFLVTLLELGHADYKVQFENLHFVDYVSKYEKLLLENRETKYAVEQKARRIRIGFEALETYGEKLNRHNVMLLKEEFKEPLTQALTYLSGANPKISKLNRELASVLGSEPQLREFIKSNLTPEITEAENFMMAKAELIKGMSSVAESIGRMWTDDRYVRAPFDLDEE